MRKNKGQYPKVHPEGTEPILAYACMRVSTGKGNIFEGKFCKRSLQLC